MKWRGALPRLVGMVLDTAGHPSANASVIISGWQTRDTVTASSDGRFVSPFLPPSLYAVTAIESMFIGYGNFRPAMTGARQWGGEMEIEITEQPRSSLLPLMCARQAYLPGLGVVLGRAVNIDGAPAAELEVTASWTVADSSGSVERSRKFETHADGRFLVCGLPLDRAIRLRASTRHAGADVVIHAGSHDVIPVTLTLAPRP
jgi:hypothetical protein